MKAESQNFDERRRLWEFFSVATTKGPHDLRQALGVDEASFRMLVGSAHADARAYFIYRALDEVQKASISIKKWQDFLSQPEDNKKFDRTNQLDRVIVESIADEQSLWCRKLLEVLANLILFHGTNEQAYYRHFLLLADLQYFLTSQEDSRDFYSCTSQNTEYSIQSYLKEIARLEANEVDVSKCWHLKDNKSVTARLPKPGLVFSSVRNRLRKALKMATDGDKLAMGFSYQQFFATSSGDLHFNVSSLTKDYDLHIVETGIGHAGVLGLRTLMHCQQLTGIAPDGINAEVRKYYESDREHVEFCRGLVGGRANVGDFVLAGNDLAEVVELKISEFGYEAYRVRYLAERPLDQISEDWFIARHILPLFKRKNRANGWDRLVSEGKLPADLAAKLRALPVETQDDAYRRAVVDVWQNGLRTYIHEKLKRTQLCELSAGNGKAASGRNTPKPSPDQQMPV